LITGHSVKEKSVALTLEISGVAERTWCGG
jgi:hypothetical protein